MSSSGNAPLIIVMGVTACGKSTISTALAAELGCPFIEGDEHHPAANIEKMKAGHPLDDADRMPWVRALLNEVEACPPDGPVVLACSALTRSVQSALNMTARQVCWAHLVLDETSLHERMEKRAHFMPPTLLQSQLDALDPPEDARAFDAGQSVTATVESIRATFAL